MSRIIALTLKSVETIILKKILLVVLIIAIVFSIVVVKVKSLELGYEIEDLKKVTFSKQIELEKFEKKLAYLKSTERLLEKSKQFGLAIPDPKRVYYVK